MTKTKQIIYCGVMIALGVIIPIGFHAVGAAGSIFLPMHIPVFIAGVLLGPWYGLLTGLITPALSTLITGMPPLLPMLPIMLVELSLYGLIIGLICKKKQRVYLGLVISMIVGRIGAGLVVWIMVSLLHFTGLPINPLVFIWASIVKGLPGIVIQLVLIPLFIHYLRKEIKDVKGIF